ncbi:uncharacterized protein LOC112464666, partial [Temnothorax curvispinosus]|uniref:Uncharacterized protein LOC112464666 n=1 Tax=Temnothorax curvispinosus TaxID=300111 RepID=A0A6J1R405_9HYME
MDITLGEEDDLVEAENIKYLDDDIDDYNVIQASVAGSAIQASEAIIETSNINNNNENTENYDPSTLTKSKRISSRQKVNEVKDSTRILADVAEKTYTMKKKFCDDLIL